MSFHRVIAEGEVPKKPVSPNVTLITVLAGFLGFLFGVLGVYAVHFLKGRINEASMIQKNSETPLLAEVPFLKTPQDKETWFLRWAMELEIKGMVAKGTVLTISSFEDKEGKRFTVDGLCQGLQKIGKRCVIIDADNSMQASARTGMINSSEFPAQWMVPENWQQYIQDIRNRYDVVLVKNMAVTQSPAALMLMAAADHNLFLFDSRRTKQKMVLQADLLKEELKLPGWHYVLNRAGYTPSIFSSASQLLAQGRKRFKS
jgi:hypothetical protein